MSSKNQFDVEATYVSEIQALAYGFGVRLAFGERYGPSSEETRYHLSVFMPMSVFNRFVDEAIELRKKMAVGAPENAVQT